MPIVHHHSLAATLDALNEAFFAHSPLSRDQRKEAATWIAGFQNGASPYTGFAASERERREGVRLFSGERLRTRFAANEILGLEACRALILLDVRTNGVREVLERANSRLPDACFAGSCIQGECAHATVAVWRYLAVGGLDHAERRLNSTMDALSGHREGSGRWKRYPFYYTLLALSEIDLPSAVEEMRYAAPTCERYLRRSLKEDDISRRRRAIMERVLSRC